jgi:hypothetical protein
MNVNLSPEAELTVGAISAGIVYAVFGQNVPTLADVRADKPGNVNTHKSVKHAVITSTIVVTGLALLGKSPTVFIIGGSMILFEGWKYHFANYGANGTEENKAPTVPTMAG